MRVRGGGRLGAALFFAFCLGLAGSLRPTVSLLCSPLLVFVLWGRGLRWWLASAAAGAAAVLLWLLPLVALAGGIDLYRRASQALLSDLFVSNFSPFGGRATGLSLRYQASMFLVAVTLAVPAFLAWHGREAQARSASWRRAVLALVGANLVFYAVTFVAEVGYLAAVAAISVLVAATWPRRPGLGLALRAGGVLVALPLFVLVGPASVRLPFGHQELGLPTLSWVVEVEQLHRAHERAVCRHAGPDGLLLLSDHPSLTHNRYLPLRCPGLVFGLHLYHPPLAPSLDVWSFYTADAQHNVPTPVPLEDGPPARGRVPRAVARVILGQDASEALHAFLLAHARCAPLVGHTGPGRWPAGPVVWPARCLPEIARGKHRIVVPAAEAPLE